MLFEGGEKDSVMRRFGKGLPPHVRLLFGLPTCGRSAFRPSLVELVLHSPCCSVPAHAVSLLPYHTTPNQQLLLYFPSHDIRTPQVYPILYYDALQHPAVFSFLCPPPFHHSRLDCSPSLAGTPLPIFICSWASFRRFWSALSVCLRLLYTICLVSAIQECTL